MGQIIQLKGIRSSRDRQISISSVTSYSTPSTLSEQVSKRASSILLA